jgi:glutamate--cysteine ligase
MRKAEEHRDYFRSKVLTPETVEHYRCLAAESQRKQQQMEAADSLSFDDFLAGYYQQ